MSQIETTPLLNPTHIVENPNQLLQVKGTAQFENFLSDNPSLIRDQDPTFSSEQMDWVKFSKKNKYFRTIDWFITSSGTYATIEINWALIKTFIPVGLNFQTFFNFKEFFISIKPTNNAYFQGLTKIFFEPFPKGYISRMFNIIEPLPLTRLWQLTCANMSPKTSDEINLVIPINFPFNFWKVLSSSDDVDVITYLENYSFGTLSFHAVSQLRTTSALAGLSFTISGQVIDLTSAGTAL